jgi:hypothetical protein
MNTEKRNVGITKGRPKKEYFSTSKELEQENIIETAPKSSIKEEKIYYKMEEEKKTTSLFPDWEIKERIYVLCGKSTPISYMLRTRHTEHKELTYFDPKTKKPRALRYVTNQPTFFVDEQVDPYILGPVVIEDGRLTVAAHQTILQQFLEIHPDNKKNGGSVFFEFDPERAAEETIQKELSEYEAIKIVLNMSIDDLESIGRIYFHSKVDVMGSSELKRDLILEAKSNPEKFINVANDPNTKLKNLAQRALDLGILKLGEDNTTIVWKDSGIELMKVPFGENIMFSIAQFFRTSEGIQAMETIGNKLR